MVGSDGERYAEVDYQASRISTCKVVDKSIVPSTCKTSSRTIPFTNLIRPLFVGIKPGQPIQVEFT